MPSRPVGLATTTSEATVAALGAQPHHTALFHARRQRRRPTHDLGAVRGQIIGRKVPKGTSPDIGAGEEQPTR